MPDNQELLEEYCEEAFDAIVNETNLFDHNYKKFQRLISCGKKSIQLGCFPKDMDPQCIELCRAMNEISGIITINSCCGHSKEPMWICFAAKNRSGLFKILSIVDHAFKCEICVVDNNKPNYFIYYLYSYSKGKKIYNEALELAKKLQIANNK